MAVKVAAQGDNKDKKRISVSGTLVQDGLISLEEYNRKLTGRVGLNIYEEMRRSDGSTSAALRIVKLPVRSAKWDVKAGGDDEQDIAAAELVRKNIKYLTWSELLREILLFLDFGYSVFERVVGLIEDEDGDYLGITEFGSIKQRTILKWQQDSNKEPGITQEDPNGGPNLNVPMDKLIIFTNEKEGDNYEGISLLRPAYKHWYIKDQLYKIDALAHERQGLGVPKLTTPEEPNQADLDNAREVAKNLRANQAAYVEEPEGYTLDFMDMKAKTVREPLGSIDHHTVQIMKSVLAQFLELSSGGSKGGSNALSLDQSSLFMKSEEALAEYIKEQMDKYFIPIIVKMNYPNAKMPTMTYTNIADTNTEMLANAVQKLLTARAITPEAGLEKHLRNVFDLPDLPEEIEEDYENRVLPDSDLIVEEDKPSEASFRRAIKFLDRIAYASIDKKPRRKAKR